jgi:hypothetical protein
VVEQSQQKLNCALPTQVARLEDGPAQVCKNWGCDRFSLIKNFPKARKSRGNLNSRSDEPRMEAAAANGSGYNYSGF